MVIFTMAWDLPVGHEKLHVYANKARADWIPTTLKSDGVVEVSSYRNPLDDSPQVLVVVSFQNMDAWQRYVLSSDHRRIMRELRMLGCTGFQSNVWAPSRLQPEPAHPGDEPRHVEDMRSVTGL